MNLQKMYETQKKLINRIEVEHPLKEKEDRFSKKILALIVEVAECANENRGFKYWSYNQEPNTKALRKPAMMEEDKEYYNPQLEEYVDGLHMVLELGIDLDINLNHEFKAYHPSKSPDADNVIQQLLDIFEQIVYVRHYGVSAYHVLVDMYIGLGELLGYKWEQIEQAYINKNEINHQRQDNGY